MCSELCYTTKDNNAKRGASDMLELAQTIMHKAILHILPAGSTRGRAFTDLVLGMPKSS